jgi:hypothetical protein
MSQPLALAANAVVIFATVKYIELVPVWLMVGKNDTQTYSADKVIPLRHHEPFL